MAEERHRSLEREREFLRDTSHAIRTPVTIARGHVELIQGIARDQHVPLSGVKVQIGGMMDRANPVRKDLMVFNSVRIRFQFAGVTQAQGSDLVERFKVR